MVGGSGWRLPPARCLESHTGGHFAGDHGRSHTDAYVGPQIEPLPMVWRRLEMVILSKSEQNIADLVDLTVSVYELSALLNRAGVLIGCTYAPDHLLRVIGRLSRPALRGPRLHCMCISIKKRRNSPWQTHLPSIAYQSGWKEMCAPSQARNVFDAPHFCHVRYSA